MRALVVSKYGPYDSHGLQDQPDPVPGPGEVLVETRAMSVNFPDVLMVEGLYQHKPAVPFIAGFDAAGLVLATGAEVTRATPGDHVLLYTPNGAFAEKVVASETSVYQMPEGMDFTEAAAFGLVYLTAHISMIENARCQSGEAVLVTGASGGVGLAMIQYGAALGVRMIGGVTSDEKAALVRENGAVGTVDLSPDGLRDKVRDQVYQQTDGNGVDVVMDMVGGDVFDASLRAIARGGRIAIVGFASGRIPVIKANYLLIKQITAIGSPLGSRRNDTVPMRDRGMAAVLACWSSGRLKPHISETFRLADWKTAFSRFKTRSVTGKIVMIP